MNMTFRQYIASCIESFWASDGVDEEVCKHCKNYATCAALAEKDKYLPTSECRKALTELLDSPVESDPEFFKLLREGFSEAAE